MSEQIPSKALADPDSSTGRSLSYGAYREGHVPAVTGRVPAETTSNSLEFWSLVHTFLKHKLLIAIITILGTILTAVYVSKQTPLYKSFSTIEFQKQEQQILDTQSVTASSVADKEYISTQFVILRSTALAGRVVNRLKLYRDAGFAPQTLSKDARIGIATKKVVAGINIQAVARTRIARVEFVHEDSKMAALVANALVKNYTDSTLERKYQETDYARRFLSERLAQAKENLESSELQIVQYAKENDIFDLKSGAESSSLEVDSILALNQALASSQTERIEKEQSYLAVQAAPPELTVMENNTVQSLQNKLLDVQSLYSERLSVFKPSYPDMIKLQEQIDALEAQIVQEREIIINNALATAKAEFDAATAKEAALALKVRALKVSLQGEQDDRIQYTILQRELDTARTQYEGLLQRLKEVTISSGVGASQVSVVDKATVVSRAFKPRVLPTILMAFFASLLSGCALAWLISFIDDTIKTPDDVKKRLGISTLAVVPKLAGAIERGNLVINALKDPKSPISEAFYAARTSLEFSTEGGMPKSILITSTQPGEGKSSTSLSIAYSFAKLGKKVLIVDADMRKPTFVSDARRTVGLSGVLTSEVSLMDNVMPSDLKGLSLLPSGAIPPNPAELLTGWKVRNVIEEAQNAFDLVIIDAPPLLSFADAPTLAALCEGTVLVVKSGKVRTGAVKHTLNRLYEHNANVLGAILSQFDAKSAGYGSGYGYYSYNYKTGTYGYGYSNDQLSDSEKSNRKILLIGGPLRPSDEDEETNSEIENTLEAS